MIPPLNFILIIIIILLLLLTTINSIAPPGPQSRQHTNSSVPCVHTNSHVHANSIYPTLSHLDAIMGELQTTTQQSASTTSSNNDKQEDTQKFFNNIIDQTPNRIYTERRHQSLASTITHSKALRFDNINRTGTKLYIRFIR